MNGRIILDTGPWVAFHCRDDARHEWAREQFSVLSAHGESYRVLRARIQVHYNGASISRMESPRPDAKAMRQSGC